MVDPFSVAQVIGSIFELLSKAIDMAHQAKHFRPLCMELKRSAALLLRILQKNDSAIRTMESANQLKECLEELHQFIIRCIGEWNFLEKAKELYVQKKLPALQQRLDRWIRICILETVLESRVDVMELRPAIQDDMQKLTEYQSRIDENIETNAKKANEDYRTLADLVRADKQPQHTTSIPPGVDIKFLENDARLKVTPDGNGILSGSLEGVGDVLLVPVDATSMRYSSNGPRHSEIYQRISRDTLVQSFYGLAQRTKSDGSSIAMYAVMEDVKDLSSVADVILEKKDVGWNMSKPSALIRFLFELGNTIAFFHGLDLVMKIISDENILLKPISNQQTIWFQPRLINIIQARWIQEGSQSVELDTRFEAPEWLTRPVHTQRTDIWSLGLVILECLTSSFPYSACPFSKKGAESEDTITALLREKTPPFLIPEDAISHPALKALFTIGKACCHRNPKIRPASAKSVAESIFEILHFEQLPSGSSRLNQNDSELKKIQEHAWKAIAARRADKPSCNISDDEGKILRVSAVGGIDDVSSFLFGAAIFYGLVSVPEDDQSQGDRLRGLAPDPEISRAQAALRYLESACDAGNKDAARECAYAHHKLMQYYTNQVEKTKTTPISDFK